MFFVISFYRSLRYSFLVAFSFKNFSKTNLTAIAVEIFANSIRNDQSIMGINIKGKEYKLSQYADDTSCFVRDIDSVVRLFEKLEAFKSCSGLERNRSKTEAMWLGKNNPQPTNRLDINWPLKRVYLSVCFYIIFHWLLKKGCGNAIYAPIGLFRGALSEGSSCAVLNKCQLCGGKFCFFPTPGKLYS